MKKIKKVLFSATVDSHIMQFHLPYLKWFKEQGYEVHVATNGTQNIPYCDVKHVVPFNRKPIRFTNLKAIRVLKKIIQKEQFDIIHCHTPMGGAVTRLAAKRSRKNGTRVIYTAHGFHFYKGAPLINWLVYFPVEWYLAKYTDTIITINKEDYERANRKFIKRCNDIQYVPGVGIDEDKFSFEMSNDEKNRLKGDLGINPDAFVITQIGELNKNKNQSMAINAMIDLIKYNNRIHLLIIGQGDLESIYKRKIKENNLENNIHLLGYRLDIPKLLKISNVLLSLSYREGLPVNVIEAMCCNLPIIATDCRGNRDLLSKCININDKESLVKEIKDIINSNKTKVEYNVQEYLLKSILQKLIIIYKYSLKKNIIILRSTDIFNDSRIQKEINILSDNNLIVIGWDREDKYQKCVKKNNYLIYYCKIKAKYGQKTKNLLNILRFEIFILRKLIRLRSKYQYVFSCDLDTGIISRIVSKVLHKKMIYDIYDYYVDSHQITGFFRKIIEKQEIKCINYASTTIICNEERREQIKKAKPNNLVIIHNTPNLPNELGSEPSIITSKTNKAKIAYVGILQDDRLLCEIAEYVKNNHQYEFHIGGFGKYKNYFKNISKQNENIFFYGELDYNSVLKLESECDILFATYNPEIINHKYSAPNKFYEAISLRKTNNCL